jgi:aminoglycoside phosphotransferase (APT) family kinase protein
MRAGFDRCVRLYTRGVDAPPLARDSLETWLHGRPGFERARVGGARLAAGGISNLTYRVDLADASFRAIAVRVQRELGIFAPYDVVREARVVDCLAGTVVPVPRVIGCAPEPDALGAPFAVYEWIEAPHMGEAPDADFAAYTRAVASIHAVDWCAAGLDFLGVPASPQDALRTEIDRITARLDAFGLNESPLLSSAFDQLVASVPADGALALCQGDINVFNYLFRGGAVVGVVDWEQARISDPRSDIAHLLALSNLKGSAFIAADDMPFARAYGVAAGSAVTELAWFRARWLFELGVIWRICDEVLGAAIWYAWEDIEDLLPRALAEVRRGRLSKQ